MNDFMDTYKLRTSQPAASNSRSRRPSEFAERISPQNFKNLQDNQLVADDSSTIRLQDHQHRIKQENPEPKRSSRQQIV